MISEDIIRRRGEYEQLMHDTAQSSPPEIVTAVAETQRQLLALFESAPESQAIANPAPDEWSLRDLALHAGIVERLVAQLVHHMARGSTPPREYFEGAGIGMIPKDMDRPYAQALDDLRRHNEELLEAVRNLPEHPNIEMKLPHPFFGPLNCLEWAGFQRVHDLDHIQHAEKILSGPSL
jgi:hypothetical protein